MVKNSYLYVVLLGGLLSFSSQGWGRMDIDDLVDDTGNVQEAIEQLGEDHVYEKKSHCNEHSHGSSRRCQNIPYKVETCFPFFTSDAECAQKKARNIERRNQWLLESGKFQVAGEEKLQSIQEEKSNLENALGDYRQASQQIDNQLESNQERIQHLRDRYSELESRKDELSQKAMQLQENNPDILAGEQSLGEDLQGAFTGDNVSYDEQDEQDLEELRETQRELRSVLRDMQGLGNEVDSTVAESRQSSQELQLLEEGIQESESALELYGRAYAQAAQEVEGEEAQQRAYVEAETLEAKEKAARRFAREKVDELKDQQQMSEFVLRDLQSLSRDLGLNELETEALLGKVNNQIEKSLLGKYIQEQMEKAQGSAVEEACRKAKLCTENPSIFDGGRSGIPVEGRFEDQAAGEERGESNEER